jgi:uncharacterized protein
MADRGAWITTFSGRRFYVLDPRPSDVRIEDIAHSLSLQCRFNGHVNNFYSVAQHSVLVSERCDPADALYGLLHDASEAYIGDMSAPLKRTDEMTAFRDAERHVMNAIVDRFILPFKEPISVRIADRRMLLTEARDLGIDVTGWYKGYEPFITKITPWPPQVAEQAFLSRFTSLWCDQSADAVSQADGWVDQEIDTHGH